MYAITPPIGSISCKMHGYDTTRMGVSCKMPDCITGQGYTMPISRLTGHLRLLPVYPKVWFDVSAYAIGCYVDIGWCPCGGTVTLGLLVVGVYGCRSNWKRERAVCHAPPIGRYRYRLFRPCFALVSPEPALTHHPDAADVKPCSVTS